jgi:hypothetical protein
MRCSVLLSAKWHQRVEQSSPLCNRHAQQQQRGNETSTDHCWCLCSTYYTRSCVPLQEFSAANGLLTRAALLAIACIGTAAVDQTVLHLAVRFGLVHRYLAVSLSITGNTQQQMSQSFVAVLAASRCSSTVKLCWTESKRTSAALPSLRCATHPLNTD